TGFWAIMGAGAIVFVIGALAMPIIASIYSEPRLIGLGVAYAATFLTGSLGGLPHAILSREMAFGRTVVLSLVGAVLSVGISITFAYLGFGPWSFVFGLLGSQIPTGLLGLWLVGFRPRWHFRWEELRKLRRFSLFLTAEIAANYLYNNLDYLTVGYVLGRTAHGFYTQAFNLVHMPYSQITPVVTRVMFAAFARQQTDDAALRDGYLKVTSGLLVITTPLVAYTAVGAELVVSVLLGPKWMSIVSYVRILAIVGALKCVVTCVGLIINAKGRSDIGFRLNLLGLGAMAIGMLIGVRYGVAGICWVWVAIFLPITVIVKAASHKLIGLSARAYLAAMARPALFVAGFTLMLILARHALVTHLPGVDMKRVGLLLLGLALPLYALGVRLICPEIWARFFDRKRAAKVASTQGTPQG
ncbi:MAG TPA: lipopolysaccharide biosynthesis protein, partial [Polyangiaceae bacterium]|nr:lipopolysaccharide biosynthesis protein [Polyangiaceae bacterium]